MTARDEPRSAVAEAAQTQADDAGRTQLHWAASPRGTDDIMLLLDSGASIDAQDEDGLTPLMVATRYGMTENCKALLARGANVHLRDREGNPALHCACPEEDTTAAKLLLKGGADIEAISSNGGTALQRAATLGEEHFVKFLIRNRADIESKLVDGMTALHCASSAGQDITVQILIAFGANPNAIDDRGRTPLWFATRWGYLQVVKILLKATTTNINNQIFNGPTALSTAARHGYNSIVKVLLEAGAEIIPREAGPHVPFLDPKRRLRDYGLDAVVEACGARHEEVCRTLLEAGAKADPGEYARWLQVWDRMEYEEMRAFAAWVYVRKQRCTTPKRDALRDATFTTVRELEQGKRRKIAEEMGVPYVEPKFAQRDAELGINLEDDSEHEIDVESGED